MNVSLSEIWLTMATVLPRKRVLTARDWNLREEKWTQRHEGGISESDGGSGASRCFVFVDGELDERRQSGFIAETLQQTLRDIQCFPPDGLTRNNKSPLCFCLRQRIFLNSLLFCASPLLSSFLSFCIMRYFHCGYNSVNRRWPVGNAASLHIGFSVRALRYTHSF